MSNNRTFDRFIMPMVIILLVLQLVASQAAWVIDPTGDRGVDFFALFLGIDLVAFSMISYSFRVESRGGTVNMTLLYEGMLFICLLFTEIVIVWI